MVSRSVCVCPHVTQEYPNNYWGGWKGWFEWSVLLGGSVGGFLWPLPSSSIPYPSPRPGWKVLEIQLRGLLTLEFGIPFSGRR